MIRGWTAGIIDGEGNIRLEAVRVDNTDLRILRKLKKSWGGSIHENKRNNRPNSKRIWYWRLCGKKTIFFLESIEPFLVSKGGLARETINFNKKGKSLG